MPSRVGVIRVLPAGLLVVATAFCAYCVWLLPPQTRPPALVWTAYFSLGLGWFSAAGRLIRLLARDIHWVGSAVGSGVGIGILAMGFIAVHPNYRESGLLEHILTICFIGCFTTGYGLLATIPAVFLRCLIGKGGGPNERPGPVHHGLIGFATGVASLFTLMFFEFMFWNAASFPLYQSRNPFVPSVFAMAGYFGARGELLAYRLRRSSLVLRAAAPPPAVVVAEVVAVPTVGGV
jgi:hypothetical protein